MKAAIIVTDGFEELEAAGAYAILRRGGVEVDVYALNGGAATGRFGLTVDGLRPLAEFAPDGYQALILPGGPQYRALEASPRVREILRDFYERRLYVCAICAGPTILGRMGLLRRRHYTCFTSMNEDFGGEYLEDYVVRDGRIITGKSAAASIDFGLAVLEALAGRETAEKIKAQIYYV